MKERQANLVLQNESLIKLEAIMDHLNSYVHLPIPNCTYGYFGGGGGGSGGAGGGGIVRLVLVRKFSNLLNPYVNLPSII